MRTFKKIAKTSNILLDFCAQTEKCLDKLSSELFVHVASRELCVHGTDIVLEAEHDGPVMRVQAKTTSTGQVILH